MPALVIGTGEKLHFVIEIVFCLRSEEGVRIILDPGPGILDQHTKRKGSQKVANLSVGFDAFSEE